jgi:TonB-linked SusC/RagA family outer membrane protein
MLGVFPFHAIGQSALIQGQIFSANDSLTLPGVTVNVKGTSKGITSDFDGKFQLLTNIGDTLVFRFVGLTSQEFVVSKTEDIKIYMEEDVAKLDEVVITAFGISREKKALGYSVSELNEDDLNKSKDVNVMNTLSGKVSGVQISKTSGGVESSSRIVIRGNSSLSGNNQPLFIVDGVPIDNTTNGSGGTWGGIDYGSPISDINPDDIESMSVLKGPNAAALYGSRAANGVIIITTKKGIGRSGLGVDYGLSWTWQTPDIQKEFQNVYGAGTNGQFEYDNATGLPYFNTSLLAKSWGPQMNGQTYIDWDGVTRTFSPQPNNYRDFFRTGNTMTNSLAISGGNSTTSFRFSYSGLLNDGYTPNSEFKRNSVSIRGGSQLGKRLTADAKVSYNNQSAMNRLNLSDGRGAARNYNFMPRNISTESLQDYQDADGNEKVWYTPWAWQSNPYWVAYENLNQDSRDRVLGHVSLNLEITPWLSLSGQSGLDFYNERRKEITGTGAFANPKGNVRNAWISLMERNNSFLFNAQHELNKSLGVSATFGGNQMFRQTEQNGTYVRNLSVPDFYHPQYGEEATEVNYNLSQKRINSLYGSVHFDFRHILFFDVTARNDWSSTLPASNNSYFYPSFNASYVFSKALKLENDWFTFGKVRSSYAQVGADADPYMLSLTYTSQGTFNGLPLVTLNNVLPLSTLKPEITSSYELGCDLRFIKNRIGVDFTYYNSTTKNQIVPANVSYATGYTTAIINAGEISNKGIELLLTTTPVKRKKFEWKAIANFTRNKSMVVQLSEGLENYELGSQWGVSVEARPGRPYGDIVGVSIARDAENQKLIDENGMYLKGDRKVLGNFNPDFMLGINNSFEYRNFSMGFLIDIRVGGQFYSASNMYAHGYSGTVVQTLEGREEWYQSEQDRIAAGVSPEDWVATGGYLAEGVYADGTIIDGEDVSGQENTTYVNPELYWGQFSNWGNELHEPHVYDADFIKLREVYFMYKLPKSFCQKLHVNALSVGFVGRNLWLIYSKAPNIDPESSYTNGNGQGIEYGTYPVSRSLGFTLNAKF